MTRPFRLLLVAVAVVYAAWLAAKVARLIGDDIRTAAVQVAYDGGAR